MLFTVGTGYFLWVNNNNSTYSQALAQRGTDVQNQQQEDLVLNASRGLTGDLDLAVRNVGGIASNITEILVTYPSSLTPPPCPMGEVGVPQSNFCGFGIGFDQNSNPVLPLVISAQTNSSTIDTTVPVPAGTSSPETYTVKVVTANGNTFSTAFSPEVTSIITQLLPSSIVTVGSPVNDSAVLVGVTATAGGSVEYYWYSGSTCSSGATPVSTQTVKNGGVPNSAAYAFATAGSYSWNAKYSGDSNNPSASSPCEPLVVQATPTLTTTLNPQVVAVGSAVSDSAVISGLTPGAAGSVSYYYSNVNSCPATGATFAGESNVLNGLVGSSTQVTFPVAGTAYWYAVYSGDTYDTGTVSPCEPLSVGNFPTITTSLPATSIALGGSSTDSATLAGAANDKGGGATITFWWSFVNACPTNGATEVSAVSVGNPEDGTYTSNPSRPFNTPGVYYWYATYSGDTYNAGAISPCEPLTVGLAITTTLSAATINAGGSVTDFATLHFATANAGGSVAYYYFDSSDCSGTANPEGTSKVVNGGVQSASSSQTFSAAGSYSWDAVYSGDSNNKGPVTSPCESLTVLPSSGGGSGGSLGLVSESFRFYLTNCNSESNSGTCPPGTGDGVSVGGYYGYGLSYNPLPTCTGFFFGCLFGGQPTANPDVFQIKVTNTDPSRTVTLSAQSFLFIQGQCSVTFLCDFLSTPFAQSYWIISPPTSSGGNGAVVSPYNNASPVTIAPGTTQTLYFYCTGGPCTSAVSPSPGSKENAPPAGESLVVSVGLFGIYSDGTPFAQTIPYVASYVSPVYITNVSPSQPAGALWLTGGVGQTITLTAANFPTQPSTVSVYWTNADGTTSVVGTASGSGCTYVSSSTSYTCTVSFTVPSTAIAGEFYGIYVTSDGVDNAYATVGVTGASSTTVSCAPSPINVGGKSTCSAMVTGVSPTGTVSWSQSPTGIVSFSSTTCTLVGGTCSITVTGTSQGTTTITGSYSGDINNVGSSGTFQLTVNQATPTITTTLSATSVPTGHPVTDSASLTGATSNAGGTVQYEYFSSNTCSGTPTNDGAAVTVTNGVVPNSPSKSFSSTGSYGWEAVYSGDTNNAGTTSSCEPLAVTTASLTIAPSQGPTGTKTTLSGSGYAFSFSYNICLSTSAASVSCVTGSGTTFTSSPTGTIPTGVTVTVPSGTTSGTYYVIVYTSTSVIDSATFTVTTATITLTPTQGFSGKSVTVTGSGFSTNTPISTFTFNGATPSTQTCTSQTTSATGAFTCTFTVPSSSSGAKTVTASGSDVGTVTGDSASTTFTVLVPTITLSPAQGPKGVTVAVTGSSFSPNTGIATFTFNGATPGTQGCTSQTTTGTGAFACTFTVPSLAAGTYNVVATGADGGTDTATASFTITAPAISLSPSSGPVGTTVTISGTGFSPNVAVDAPTIAGGTISTQTCTSQTISASGTFSCTFNVPTDSTGTHTVTISGADVGTVPSDTASQTFTISVSKGFDSTCVAFGSVSSGTTITLTLPSCKAGDLIVVAISGSSSSGTLAVSSVSDTAGLTYTQRTSEKAGGESLFEWYAFSTGSLSSDTITVRMSATHAYSIEAFGFTGVSQSNIFDSNSAVPARSSGSFSTPSVSGVSTSNANDIIIAMEGDGSGSAQTVGTGYTLIAAQNPSSGQTIAVEYEVVSTTQSGATVSFGSSTFSNWVMIADAIDPASQSISIMGQASTSGQNVTSLQSMTMGTTPGLLLAIAIFVDPRSGGLLAPRKSRFRRERLITK